MNWSSQAQPSDFWVSEAQPSDFWSSQARPSDLWVMGLDGGGSKTLMALANQNGEMLGPFAAKGINPFDNPQWKTNLSKVLVQSPIAWSDIAHTTLGMPGYSEVGAMSAEQESVAAQLTNGRPHSVLNDVHAAFVGALAGQAGVLILSGTGSMAWGGVGEKQVRVGGWGDAFGDEGSAYWIGHRALEYLSKTLDGRIQDPDFATAMLGQIGVKDMEGLLAWFYGLEHPRSYVARLAKAVDQLADQMNPTALSLMHQATDELVLLAQTAFRLLDNPKANRFSFAGSVFNSRTVRQRVKEKLTNIGFWQMPVLAPIGGALLHAADKAGWNTDAGWITRLQAALTERFL